MWPNGTSVDETCVVVRLPRMGRVEAMQPLAGKRVLITGGTGSLGKVLTKRILAGAFGDVERVVILSRDEAKQHAMRMDYLNRSVATDEVIFENFRRTLEFVIGDVRDPFTVVAACRDIDVVFNAAALKQVPSCEYFPAEAVKTNIDGANSLVRAVKEHRLPVETVVGISTDKACKPVNVMGMTKAVQERIFISANLGSTSTRFVCARYGNVLASRGSVIPLFRDQIASGGPLTITTPEMTRFLLSLDDAVDTIIAAVADASPGQTFIPRVPAARVTDIAKAMIGDLDIDVQTIGIRPGEKVHESLISEEEAGRTVVSGDYFAIEPMLPELAGPVDEPALDGEFSSDRFVMGYDDARALLDRHGLLDPDHGADELLR